MIGPHEGKELELMLAGKKHLAAFGDIIPESGIIDEIIIPEKKFAPYVKNGQIIRIEAHYKTQEGYIKKTVCFTLPNEEWRAHTYIFLRKKLNDRIVKYTDPYDEVFGFLLDYTIEDIKHFLSQ